MARLFGDYSAPGNNECFVNADVCPHGISGSTQRHAEPCVFKTSTTPCRCSRIGLVFSLVLLAGQQSSMGWALGPLHGGLLFCTTTTQHPSSACSSTLVLGKTLNCCITQHPSSSCSSSLVLGKARNCCIAWNPSSAYSSSPVPNQTLNCLFVIWPYASAVGFAN